MASIERREGKKGSSYRVKWRDASGRQRSKTYRRARDARRFARLVEARSEEQGYQGHQVVAITVQEWFWRVLEASEVKPKTRAGYISLFRTWVQPSLGAYPLAAVRPIDIELLLNGMTTSGARRRQVYALLTKLFRAARANRLIHEDPLEHVSRPRVETRPGRFLKPAEVERLASACGHYRSLILFLSYSGARWGEAMGLMGDAVGSDQVIIRRAVVEVSGRPIVTTPKSHRARTVGVPAAILAPLRRTGAVFTTPSGGRIAHGNFTSRVFRPAVEQAALGQLRIHDLRHTCAAWLLTAGVPIKAVQMHLGHASPRTTLETYGHLLGDATAIARTALESMEGALSSPGHGPDD